VLPAAMKEMEKAMATGLIEVRVRHLTALAVLDLGGDITSQAQQDLNAAYDEAVQIDPSAVLLNFTAVSYINSTGIALLVGILARARKEHRRVMACGLTPHYTEIFQVTRLADFMDLFDTEDAAIQALSPAGA
jgi:anti-sigma B factor antagonist